MEKVPDDQGDAIVTSGTVLFQQDDPDALYKMEESVYMKSMRLYDSVNREEFNELNRTEINF